MEHLAVLCAASGRDEAAAIIYKAAQIRFPTPQEEFLAVDAFLSAGADLDAAVALLPAPAVWRKYTDNSATVYGASPYNAAAQERFDGFSDYTPLAITSAALRMWLAPLLKARADQARRQKP